MQARSSTWSAARGVLGGIIAEAADRVRLLAPLRDALESAARTSATPPPFAPALRGPYVAVVAEIKRRSPSKGDINSALSPADLARAYAEGGAAAISVLTEPAHFGGSIADLESARAAALPLLRKDFVIDPLQIVEARAAGASAVLLIARALPPELLCELTSASRQWHLEPLVEVRSEDELVRAVDAGAGLIGVNSRNLETLDVDRGVSDRLLPLVPAASTAIAESGVRAAPDIERAAAAGADAVLVGTALSAAADPAAALREMTRVNRRGRDGH